MAVGVRRSASELFFDSTRAVEVDAALRMTAELDDSACCELDVLASEDLLNCAGIRLTEAPLLVALSGVTGSGSSEAWEMPKSLENGADGVTGEKMLVPTSSPLAGRPSARADCNVG